MFLFKFWLNFGRVLFKYLFDFLDICFIGPVWSILFDFIKFFQYHDLICPQDGLNCYKWALSLVPKQYEDVVLTNLAGLIYKIGSLDDVYKLLHEAHKIDDKDPDTNFFLANVFALKENTERAIHHYKLTLKMVPEYEKALEFLKVNLCSTRYVLRYF